MLHAMYATSTVDNLTEGKLSRTVRTEMKCHRVNCPQAAHGDGCAGIVCYKMQGNKNSGRSVDALSFSLSLAYLVNIWRIPFYE